MISKKEFFKLKVAIVLGYNGLEFHGMQKNINVKTIEDTVEKALYNSELISEGNFNTLQKIKWSRAARTDKGVHAIANFVNCKLNITSRYLAEGETIPTEETQEQGKELSKITDKEKIQWDKVIAVVNSNLPESIRIQTIKRITKVFDVKQSARSRIYEYVGPTSMFIKDANNITEEVEQQTLERLRGFCQKFKGTHNYHNYTKAMRANDPRANRYIMEMDCELVDYKEKGKFYRFRLRGQSFIYHQIRKMIGIMTQVLQLGLKDGFIDNSFYQNSIAVWLAPPQGLFLDRVTFEGYNRKHDIPEKLEFNEEEEKKLKDFKDNVIYPLIVNAEFETKTFTKWLEETREAEAQGKILAMEESEEEEDDEEGGEEGEEGEGGKKGGKRDKRNNKRGKGKGNRNNRNQERGQKNQEKADEKKEGEGEKTGETA